MNNNFDPNSINVNVDEGQSRLFTDSGKNIENKNTDFQNNMISYYEKQQQSVEDTKAKKEEVKEELANNVTGLFGVFFNGEKIKDGEDFKTRCINASKVTIIMLAVCGLFFLTFRNSHPLDIVTNFISLISFGYGYTVLRKVDIKGVYAGMVGSIFCILSFNIIKMVTGAAYLFGMVCLLNREKSDNNKTDNNKIDS